MHASQPTSRLAWPHRPAVGMLGRMTAPPSNHTSISKFMGSISNLSSIATIAPTVWTGLAHCDTRTRTHCCCVCTMCRYSMDSLRFHVRRHRCSSQTRPPRPASCAGCSPIPAHTTPRPGLSPTPGAESMLPAAEPRVCRSCTAGATSCCSCRRSPTRAWTWWCSTSRDPRPTRCTTRRLCMNGVLRGVLCDRRQPCHRASVSTLQRRVRLVCVVSTWFDGADVT